MFDSKTVFSSKPELRYTRISATILNPLAPKKHAKKRLQRKETPPCLQKPFQKCPLKFILVRTHIRQKCTLAPICEFSIFLHYHLCIRAFVHPSLSHLCIRDLVHPFAYPFVYPFVHLCICASICVFVHSFVHLWIRAFINAFVYPFVHPFVH